MGTIDYEWVVERHDEEADEITPLACWPKLSDLNADLRRDVLQGGNVRLALVRDDCDQHGSVDERLWAYARREDGRWTLPRTFLDASDKDSFHEVPARFHDELTAMCLAGKPFIVVWGDGYRTAEPYQVFPGSNFSDANGYSDEFRAQLDELMVGEAYMNHDHGPLSVVRLRDAT